MTFDRINNRAMTELSNIQIFESTRLIKNEEPDEFLFDNDEGYFTIVDTEGYSYLIKFEYSTYTHSRTLAHGEEHGESREYFIDEVLKVSVEYENHTVALTPYQKHFMKSFLQKKLGKTSLYDIEVEDCV